MGSKKALLRLLLVVFMLSYLGAKNRVCSQEKTWNVGDKVEVEDIYTSRWEDATIIVVNDWRSSGQGMMYKARLDDRATRGETELLLRPNQIRARGAALKANPDPGGTPEATKNANGYAPAETSGGAPGVNGEALFLDQFSRVKILEGNGNSYKIRPYGCRPGYMEQTVDVSKLQPLKNLSPQDPDVRFLMGTWHLLTIGNSSWNLAWGGNDKLQINPDGTYFWNIDPKLPIARGRWITDAKAENVPANGGYRRDKTVNGIIIKDNEGREWKVYKFAFPGDPTPRIVIQHLCDGSQQMGKR